MRVVAIVQARMGSSRLPGKVLKPIAGHPMIAHVVERVRRAPGVDEVVVATSTLDLDDPLAECLTEREIPCFRGPEADVLARYYEAAQQYSADAVVRITGDCPLIAPEVVGGVVKLHTGRGGALLYTSNVVTRTWARGMDTEVFGFDALETAHREAHEEADREHVTRFMRSRDEVFDICGVESETDTSSYRLTVDEAEDLELVRLVQKALPNGWDSTYEQMIAVVSEHQLESVNAHIQQRVVS